MLFLDVLLLDCTRSSAFFKKESVKISINQIDSVKDSTKFGL